MGLFVARRLRAGTTIFAVLWLIAAGPAHANLKEAISAYRAGDYARAFKGFFTLAKDGDHIAQYNIGVMYLTGRGVEKNLNEAVKWHRQAARGGLAIAQYALGVMYYRGDGVAQDFPEAANWFRRAALQGYADAQFNLGVMYYNGQAVPQDMSEVVKWISLAAGKGHKDAMFRLAMMYEQGKPFKADPVEALHWYRKAAASGHEEAAQRAEELGARAGIANEGSAAAANPLAPVPVPASRDDEAGDAPASGALPSIPSTTIDQGDIPADISGDGEPLGGGQPSAEAETAVDAAASAEGDTGQTAAPQVAAAPAAANWTVQLGSFRTIEEAQAAWTRLNERHADILGGFEPAFQRVELNGKGVFHRLQVGPVADGAAAEALCVAVRRKTDGQPCLPVPPAR